MDTELDVPTKEQVQNLDILWLGQAFPKWMQAGYILLTAVLFCCMIWIIRNSGKIGSIGIPREPCSFCVFLADSILAANIVGVIAEMNLFYGADIGVLVSQNVYQLVPVR